MDYQEDIRSETTNSDSDEFYDEDQNYIHNSQRKRSSYVYKYFREIGEGDFREALQCIICNASVGCQTSNLGRHLHTVHNINSHGKLESEVIKRGRPSRSFIWKYCTRENEKQAFCHLCKKLLFFGGGNTSNITKHLRRKHADIIENNGEYIMDHSSPMSRDAVSNANLSLFEIKTETSADRKERKGSSYVWNYCVKLSRHTIRCKLCNKLMSFHGTANVITHLQRKHNIVGPNENGGANDTAATTFALDNTSDLIVTDEPNLMGEELDESDVGVQKRGGRGLATSVVWKYCTRLNKDTVRCSFCKKNLSYQGTSNLQRHLHRMHGIVANGRNPSMENNTSVVLNLDTIWEYCTAVDEEKVKCNMCNVLFNYQDTEEINKHMVDTHSIAGVDRQRKDIKMEEITHTVQFDELTAENWISGEADGAAIKDTKTYDILYDDLIEEDLEEHVGDVDVELIQETTNPLSPQSSHGPPSPVDENVNETKYESLKIRELKEQRLRMETEYFREKAAFYRMQKYLTALQAKKVRIELERINESGHNYNVEPTVPFTTNHVQISLD